LKGVHLNKPINAWTANNSSNKEPPLETEHEEKLLVEEVKNANGVKIECKKIEYEKPKTRTCSSKIHEV